MLRKTLLVLCATSFLAFAGHASAQEAPDKLVQRVTEEVMTIVQSDQSIQSGDRSRIRQVINDKILPNLDFERTTSLAMGRYWRDATPEQKQQVEKEFRALLIYTYSGAMTLIRDQKITYEPFRTDPAATDVEVFAHANTSQGQQVRFGYRLIKNPDGWKVYDVNVLGAWLIQTYRDSFAYEIRRSGIDGLIKTLSDKNKRLASAPVKTNPDSLKEQLPVSSGT
jgi:phospholipid transport system substrate-binding protein